MNDYDRIANIVRILQQSDTGPAISLNELAAKAGLSPFHFHRLFTKWVGTTPKAFLSCLTAAHARSLLETGRSVLDATLATGLSSPGRLHDLCVRLEAASPGEIKSGGKDWTIIAGDAETPLGTCLIAESPRGICHLTFDPPQDPREALALLSSRWFGARIVWNPSRAASLANQVFQPKSRIPRQGLRAIVRGSPFQVKVWRALLQIPEGSATTYKAVAGAAGNRAASRAAGNAIGANSLAYLIPCHRVIRETGILGNYRWGTERKAIALAWESLRRERDSRPPPRQPRREMDGRDRPHLTPKKFLVQFRFPKTGRLCCANLRQPCWAAERD